MIFLYLDEMKSLPDSDPEIYQEFLDRNRVVNKDQNVALCALGGIMPLKKINWSIKVSGLTLNPNARTKFFLIAPELGRQAEEAKEMAGTLTAIEGGTHHHTVMAFSQRDEH